jgi:hypothetical protein
MFPIRVSLVKGGAMNIQNYKLVIIFAPSRVSKAYVRQTDCHQGRCQLGHSSFTGEYFSQRLGKSFALALCNIKEWRLLKSYIALTGCAL